MNKKYLLAKKNKSAISAILVVKNEAAKLEACLQSLGWIEEIVLVDNDSKDDTVIIAKKYKCKTFSTKGNNFAERKNYAASKADNDWLLFVDADERIPVDLKEEIRQIVYSSNKGAFAIARRNFIFNKEFKHGGQWPDHVVRLMHKKSFHGWEGELHEQPKYDGKLIYLTRPLIHIKHANISEMVSKTNEWSGVEAKLMFSDNHPPMNIIRFASAAFREFWLRFVVQLSFLDGMEGVIYGIYQIFSRLISYTKLWEMQISSKKK